jgi:hypothetical protein
MNAGLRWHLLHAAAGVATAALLYWLVYGSAGPPSVGEPADLPSSACARHLGSRMTEGFSSALGGATQSNAQYRKGCKAFSAVIRPQGLVLRASSRW